jgi:chemotaxis response regulator CheB
VAQTFKGRVSVVLLSGADIDSLDGLEQIVASNGSIIIQDRKTCIMKGSLDFVKKSDLQIAEIQLADIGGYLRKN